MAKGKNLLKRTRVILAILFFISISVLFLDFRKAIPEKLYDDITWFQFIPSLLKFITIISYSALGFLVILVFTVLFGRIYCSTICPLGIFQDILIRISKRFKKKKKRNFNYAKPKNYLRYSILVLCVIVFMLGSITLVNWLDPYSTFGRFTTYFFKPLLIWTNNGLARLFENAGYYFFYHIDQVAIHASIYIIPVIFFILVVRLSIKNGRLYCNTVCPVGALLGLISKISFVKISINNTNCTSCGLCERVCKAQCMDYKNFKVDESRCINCYNCLQVCNSSAVDYKFSIPWTKAKTNEISQDGDTNNSRRKLITSSVAYLAGITGLALQQPDQISSKSTVPVNKQHPVTPPGSISINDFTSACTACSLCVSVCPTKVLQPSLFEYGLTGIMQPRMDYETGFCNYDCIKCGEACPTGAILKLNIETKQLTQLGVAKFIKENCIVETEGTDCGACAEHCPTKAVHMVPYKNDLVIPEVNENICIGCGACEYPCPAEPYRAIYVEGNEIHQLAQKPEVIELEESESEEDFPF